jgi:hypothetical protein
LNPSSCRLLLLGFYFLNGHLVVHAGHTLNVGDELGDQGHFGRVLGNAGQGDRAIPRLDLGAELEYRSFPDGLLWGETLRPYGVKPCRGYFGFPPVFALGRGSAGFR